ncbi:pyridoxamine 5'-phosphate oxidase family protein [Streptomyces sp. S.PNR 29]|uniref:pyridoxamine 5'-phosphate oxidase family protein n=1 Tax=Streptomyces sp. S.PNR 29 TaxID=2973805 RepID=UPI0025B02BF3|nr:pyridoxamine 5'-phosphate oxidase family protein [Streptomyces sp. S.PNR 29]MDN0199058.1 pyridoxamine 5'-phosphate oxidase family protein [Streptomyces sp. S.PNR 29]
MEITGPQRSREQRKQDVPARLQREAGIWVATADAGGLPCPVLLWFVRDGESVWLSTRLTSPTGRNLRDGGRDRLASAAADAFLAKHGRDPREDSPSYASFQVRPRAVQARCEHHELPQRHHMRDGVWID